MNFNIIYNIIFYFNKNISVISVRTGPNRTISVRSSPVHNKISVWSGPKKIQVWFSVHSIRSGFGPNRPNAHPCSQQSFYYLFSNKSRSKNMSLLYLKLLGKYQITSYFETERILHYFVSQYEPHNKWVNYLVGHSSELNISSWSMN